MSSPIWGRAEEIAWIRARVTAADDRPTSLTLVMGEAGIGKTRLLREAIPQDALVASVRFPHERFATPGLGLRQLAGVTAASAGRLRAALASSEDEPDRWRLLAIYRAADDVLRETAGGVIVFDDLQWADELTLGWLSQIVTSAGEPCASIVAGVRATEQLPRRLDSLLPAVRSGDIQTCHLKPLGLGPTREFARSVGQECSEEMAERLLTLTGGIPLALQEVLSELERRGHSLVELLGTQLTSLSTFPLVAGIVREQAAELDEDALQVLAIACLLPPPAEIQILERVTRLGQGAFHRALEQAIGSGLLARTGDGAVTFRHELQREAFQRELPVEEKQVLHRRIAGVMSADPQFPASPIAYQLAEAGLLDEALEWLERAAKDSGHAHDHGNALTCLEAAVDACPSDDGETLCRLSEQIVVAARCCGELQRGLTSVDTGLSRRLDRESRGRLLLCRARLVSYLGDYQERVRVLQEARDAFADTGGRRRLATVLGELAFPLGKGLSLPERVSLGIEGLGLAEQQHDPDATALCAINLASSKFYSADEDAFNYWAKAVEVLASDSPEGSLQTHLENRTEMVMRAYNNWSLAALSYGDFGRARNVLDAGLASCRVPYWRSSFICTEALYYWRTGRWDDALAAADSVEGSICRPQALAVATAVKTAILFERERRPDIEGLVNACRSLIDWSDEEFGAVAQAILIRVRLARREPAPDRDLLSLVDLVVDSGMRAGWEDLLPAAADVSATAYRRISRILEAGRLTGPRGRASFALAEGSAAATERSDEAEPLLLEAVDLFEEMSEPYSSARALEKVGDLRAIQGKRSGDCFRRACEIYESLGADRSLATVLRRIDNRRALHRFSVPASQTRSVAPGLTKREREVAELARRGYSARAIGEELGIATVTVKKHLEKIKDKLGYRRKSDLVRLLADDGESKSSF